ncbi:MAG: protein phosphatase 2C domain-containing protein, partial [Chloroflexi bacterium]|nr:protein phosphatase 2C domain-containing protein [Chloroflexota bacterium]
MAQAQNGGLSIRFVEKANIGRQKKEQQDYHGHLILPQDESKGQSAIYLFVVADGVSMGAAGALASRTAVEVLLHRFGQLVSRGATDLAEALEDAFNTASDEVARLAESQPGMATTCAAALLAGDRLITAHVGDSRIYYVQKLPPEALAKPEDATLKLKIEAKPETKLKTKAEVKPEAKLKAEAEIKPDAILETDATLKFKIEPKPDAKLKAEAEAKPDAILETDATLKLKIEPKPDAKLKAEAEIKPDAILETDATL